MFNKNKFKAAVISKGMTIMELAELLDISYTTLYRKINGESDFYREEIYKITKILEIDSPDEIFFEKNVT